MDDQVPSEHAPQEVAAFLKVFGVLRVIRVGYPPDLNVALDFGAGHAVESEHAALALFEAIRSRIRIRHDQVNFIRYADDFIVTARTKETLEQIVKPVLVAFLAQRGLELSEQKTTITHIQKGLNFLGQNLRKYRNKLVIKPAKEGLKALVQKSRECIKDCLGQTAETLIAKLNPIIRGWANYHRHVCSAKAFWNAERTVHYQLLRWAKRTHPNKSYGWLKQKYFSHQGQFGFFARQRASTGVV